LSAAYDRLVAGYYNPGLRSGSNPGGLSGRGAVRANWTAMFQDIAAVLAEGISNRDEAVEAALSALQAPGTKATSITNFAIPGATPANINLVLQEADKLFLEGQTVLVRADDNFLAAIIGPITAFDPVAKTMTVQAQYKSGAGNHAAWKIALSAPIDSTLTGRVAALEQANVQQRSDALFFAKEFI
jgi:hypothetical protein